MLIQSIVQSIIQPIVRSVIDPIIISQGFSPKSLFASGEQGAWYDPSDLPTLFQDAAGTTPVTAAGQPVGLVRDKSGRGNHASQVTSTMRPILRNSGVLWWLEFDGVDDFLVTGSVNFTSTDKLSVFAGVRKLSDSAFSILVELSASPGVNPGSFNVSAPDSAAANYGFALNRGANSSRRATSFVAPISNVLACNFDIAQSGAALEISPRVNGLIPTLTATGDAGSGNFGNYPMYIGRRAGVSAPWSGYFYGLVVRGATTVATDIASTEKYLAAKSGVTL